VEEVHLELAADIRRRLAAGEVPADRERIYRYLLADALRQAGQRIEARSLFEALAADDKLPDAYRQAARRKGFLCEREGAFQEKALAYLEQSESAALLPDDERAVAVYLQGELARRLGRIDAARAQYARAATQPSVPEWLAPIIRQQQGRLPAASPAPSAGGASGNG
jgi:tetratricopeptide (TPR) repeat protein